MKKVIEVLEQWFQAIELNVTDGKAPNLKDGVVSKEKVNFLVEIIDNFFEDELKKNSKYWQHKDRQITNPPDFNLHMRIAEAQTQAILKALGGE